MGCRVRLRHEAPRRTRVRGHLPRCARTVRAESATRIVTIQSPPSHAEAMPPLTPSRCRWSYRRQWLLQTSRLDHLLAPVLGPELQLSTGPLRLENDVRLPGACRPRE